MIAGAGPDNAADRHVVVVGDAGRETYAALIEQSDMWRAYVQMLQGAAPSTSMLAEDLFYTLYQSEVELNPRIAPDLHRNFSVLAGLLPMTAFARLRGETVGDALASAMAARRLADDLLLAWAGHEDGGEATSRNPLAGLLSLAVGVIGRRHQAGQHSATATSGSHPDHVTPDHAAIRALDRTLEETVRDRRIRQVWGIEPGISSVHALDDVWGLMQSVRSLSGFEQLTDAFAELGELLRPAAQGRRRRQRRRLEQRRFEKLQGLTRGRDVERVVPEELVRLLDDDMAGLFHEAYEHGRLVQERYGSKPPEALGPLVVCLDVSRSMNTIAARGWERFVWAKGVGLALLETARKVERPFFGICFSSENDMETVEVKINEYQPQLAIDLARCDFDGGTHFRAPLLKAVEYLEQQRASGRGGCSGQSGSGHIGSGHIVFVTDGEAALPAQFVHQFEQARQRLGFQMFTIFIDGQQPELVEMSDRVFVVNGDRLESWEQTASGLARVLGH